MTRALYILAAALIAIVLCVATYNVLAHANRVKCGPPCVGER